MFYNLLFHAVIRRGHLNNAGQKELTPMFQSVALMYYLLAPTQKETKYHYKSIT